LEAVAALLKIFMGLSLVHFQKYWLLRLMWHIATVDSDLKLDDVEND